MQFRMSVEDKKIYEWFGEDTTEEEFQEFCKDAIAIALWKKQILHANDEIISLKQVRN